MHKSLALVRVLVVLFLSVLVVLGGIIVGVGTAIFYMWLFAFLFCLSIMEIGQVFVNKVVKNKYGTFLVFCFFYAVAGFVFGSIVVRFLEVYLNLSNSIIVEVQVGLGSVILITGVFQGVCFWIRKNSNIRQILTQEKQNYLQHSFNALKSQNVIEFLQESLINTIDLIKKDQTIAMVQIEKLTSILRYLLQSRDEKFVRLGAELKNVKEYCELAEIHLNQKIELLLNLSEDFHQTHIPPLVFQMVLDNQFKNYDCASGIRLKIEVYIENGKFVVVKTSNPPVLKNNVKNERFINNLKQRYQLYNKASGVSELSTADEYFVKLPLVIG
jgi:LytS/YehU family sensor histidine kinase